MSGLVGIGVRILLLLLPAAVCCGAAASQDRGGSPPALQEIARGLQSPDSIARMSAAKRAGAMGTAAAPLMAELERLARADEDADVRRVAATALRNMQAKSQPGPRDGDAGVAPLVTRLLRELRSEDPLVRLRSAKELGRVVPTAEVLAALAAAANGDEDDDVRAVAKRAWNQLNGVREPQRGGKRAHAAPGQEVAPRRGDAGPESESEPAREPAPDPGPPPPPPAPAPAPSIVGTWNGSASMTTPNGVMTLQLTFRFRKDRTFRLESESDNGLRSLVRGTYTYRDGIVTTAGEGGGRTERGTVDWIDQDSFTYLGGGCQVTFRRTR